MPRKIDVEPQIHTVIFIDAVNFTAELKQFGRAVIAPKIATLREFIDYFFVFRLRGRVISEMGDGFLILCPPEPHKGLNEAFALLRFVRAYNHDKHSPHELTVRVAMHYGLIAPPDDRNYIDQTIVHCYSNGELMRAML